MTERKIDTLFNIFLIFTWLGVSFIITILFVLVVGMAYEQEILSLETMKLISRIFLGTMILNMVTIILWTLRK
jgi:hypothetical protein